MIKTMKEYMGVNIHTITVYILKPERDQLVFAQYCIFKAWLTRSAGFEAGSLTPCIVS